MTEYISEIHQIIGAQILDLNLSAAYSSKTIDNRQFIRSHIVSQYAAHLTTDEIKEIQNLNALPKSKKMFFSISHHPELGGYTACDLCHGFDIELKSRISDQVVKRISSPIEISLAPNIQFLWCAKESVFKALNDSNLIISDIHTLNWSSQFKTGLWSFQVESGKGYDLHRNTGFVFHDNDQIFSIFFK